MTYPGPWQQLADFEATGYRLIAFNGDAQGAVAEEPDQPRSGDPLTDMNRFLGDVAGADYVGVPESSSPFFGATLSPSANLTGRARKSLGAARFEPRSLTPPSTIIPAAPAGAVGYEWQAPTGEVVGCRIEFVNLQPNGSADNPPDVEGNWSMALGIASDAAGTVPTSFGTKTLASWTQIDNAPLSATFDVRSFVDPAGRFQLMGQGSASVGAFVDDPFGETSWGVSLAIRVNEAYYTVRPPLFRWLYNTPQVPPGIPPLRQHPRRDGLGASTARRHYPPDRSVQASNRHRGGFY